MAMTFAKLGQFVSCDTVGEIETVQAELVLYLQSVCLSLPLQPAAPGNEISNFPFMYDIEQLLGSNMIINSSYLTEGGETRKSSILESFSEERGIHSSFHRFS